MNNRKAINTKNTYRKSQYHEKKIMKIEENNKQKEIRNVYQDTKW